MKALGSLKHPAGPEGRGPRRPQAALRRFFTTQGLIWRVSLRRMRAQNAMAVASAMSYRTMLALVPALVIAFLVIKATGLVDSKQLLPEVLAKVGLTQITVNAPADRAPRHRRSAASSPQSAPSSMESYNLADKLQELISTVESKLTFARLGPLGLILLTWSAITLLTTVERSLNRVFEAPRSRPLMTRVLLYWSAITFVPIVVLAASIMGNRALAAAARAAANTPGLEGLAVVLNLLGDLVVGIVLLALIYKFMPNTKVVFRSALAGAAAAVPLWVLAKWGMGLYVTKVVGRSSPLYGSLGLIPLFLLWINICWYGFLFGAQLAYTASNLRRLLAAEGADKILLGPMELLASALAVATDYAHKRGPSTLEQIARKLALPEEPLGRLIQRLTGAGILCPVAAPVGQAYLPARPPESVRVSEILDLDRTSLPTAGPGGADDDIARALHVVKGRTHQALAEMTLADLLPPGPTSPSPEQPK